LHSILDGFGPNSLIIGNVVGGGGMKTPCVPRAMRAIRSFSSLAGLVSLAAAEIRQTSVFPFRWECFACGRSSDGRLRSIPG
jgi:hypothetical protein